MVGQFHWPVGSKRFVANINHVFFQGNLFLLLFIRQQETSQRQGEQCQSQDHFFVVLSSQA